jgi:hypothetical protein
LSTFSVAMFEPMTFSAAIVSGARNSGHYE